MTRSDKILWLDLETTGSTLAHQILEVGIVLTDATPDLNILAERNWLRPIPESLRMIELDPVVLTMHTANGLWDEVRRPSPKRHPTLASLDDSIDAWLEENGVHGEHIPFAGSGVCHFDRAFIRRDLPKLDRHLTYWALDVGVIRRVLTRLVPNYTPPTDIVDLPHRAVGDIHQQLIEMRRYIRILGDGCLTTERREMLRTLTTDLTTAYANDPALD